LLAQPDKIKAAKKIKNNFFSAYSSFFTSINCGKTPTEENIFCFGSIQSLFVQLHKKVGMGLSFYWVQKQEKYIRP